MHECLRKRLFGILRNTEFYPEVTLFPQNAAEFREISFTEFRVRNLSNKFMQEIQEFSVLRTEVEF
jgi:hypothetical protein